MTIQHLESRSRQGTGEKTSHVTPRYGYNLLHGVLQWVRDRIEDKSLHCFFLFGPCLYFCMTGKGDHSLLKAIIALCAIQTKEVCLNVIQLYCPLDVVQKRRDVVFVADSSKSWRGLPRGWTQLSTRT